MFSIFFHLVIDIIMSAFVHLSLCFLCCCLTVTGRYRRAHLHSLRGFFLIRSPCSQYLIPVFKTKQKKNPLDAEILTQSIKMCNFFGLYFAAFNN